MHAALALALSLSPSFYADGSPAWETRPLLFEGPWAYRAPADRPPLFASSRKGLEDKIRALQELAEKKGLSEAIKSVGEKAELDLILIRAELYLLSKNLPKARLDFERVLKGKPDGRAKALALDGLRRCLAAKLEGGRLDIYEPMIALLKSEWRNEEALGWLEGAYKKGLPPRALAALKKEEPILALRLGRFEKALDLWAAPADVSQTRWLAMAKLRDGRFEEAAALRLALAKSFKNEKERQKESLAAVSILAKGGFYEKALKLSRETPELKNKAAELDWLLGLSALGSSRPKEAAGHFENILKNQNLRSLHLGAEYYLGRSLETAGRNQEAARIFQKIAADKSKADYYRILAGGRLGLENQYLPSRLAALMDNGSLTGDRETLGYFLWISDKGLTGTSLSDFAETLAKAKLKKAGETEKIIKETAEGSLWAAARELKYCQDAYCDNQKALGGNKDDANRLMASLAAWAGDYRLAIRIFSYVKGDPAKPSRKWSHPLVYSREVLAAKRSWGLAPQLVLSVIRTESAFQADVISVSNAQGLMQLLPATAEKIAPRLGEAAPGPLDLFNPSLNIKYGAWYLAELKKGFGHTPLALAGYNGGPYNIKRLVEAKPSWPLDLFIDTLIMDETIKYVKKIIESQYAYEWEYLGEADHRDFSLKIKQPLPGLPSF